MNCIKLRTAVLTCAALLSVAWSGPASASCFLTFCTVDTTDDTLAGGSTSLRDAIIYANANPGTTITFVLPPNAIVAAGSVTFGPLPDITTNVMIDGVGVPGLNINGAGVYNVFSVQSGLATISNLTVNDATAIGGSGATLALSATGATTWSAGVQADGTFDISQTTTSTAIQTLSGANTGNVALGSQTLTISNGATTFDGVIADGGIAGGTGGGLAIAGGTQTLSGANTYTGITTIANGATLALSGSGSIEQSTGVQADGVFDISQTFSGATVTTLSGASTGTVALGSQTLTISNGSTTFDGVIADGGIAGGAGGGLAIGGGTQTLSGVNTYTGITTIANGATLALSGSGSIEQSSGI